MKKTSILISLIFLAFITASIIVFNYYSLIHNQSNHTGLELMKVKIFYFIISAITKVLDFFHILEDYILLKRKAWNPEKMFTELLEYEKKFGISNIQ